MCLYKLWQMEFIHFAEKLVFRSYAFKHVLKVVAMRMFIRVEARTNVQNQHHHLVRVYAMNERNTEKKIE